MCSPAGSRPLPARPPMPTYTNTLRHPHSVTHTHTHMHPPTHLPTAAHTNKYALKYARHSPPLLRRALEEVLGRVRAAAQQKDAAIVAAQQARHGARFSTLLVTQVTSCKQTCNCACFASAPPAHCSPPGCPVYTALPSLPLPMLAHMGPQRGPMHCCSVAACLPAALHAAAAG